jgi:hypothetical protein
MMMADDTMKTTELPGTEVARPRAVPAAGGCSVFVMVMKESPGRAMRLEGCGPPIDC